MDGTWCYLPIPKGGQVVSKLSGVFPTVFFAMFQKESSVTPGLSEITPYLLSNAMLHVS